MSKRLPKTHRYFNAQTLAIQESVARVNRVHELLEVLVSLQHPNISFKKVDQKLFQSSLPRHIEILQEQVQSISKDSNDASHSTLETSDSNSINTIDVKHTAQTSSEKLPWEDVTYHQDKETTEDETGNFTTPKDEVIHLSRPSPQLPASLPTLTTMGPAPPAHILFPVGPIAQISVPIQPFLGPPIFFQPMPLVSTFGPQNRIGFSSPQTPVNNLEREKLRERLLTFIKEMSPTVPGLKGLEGELTRFLLDRWDYWKLLDMMETPTMLKEQIALVFGDLQQHLKERDVKLQKQMLGERLYKTIMSSLPPKAKEKACKVTGMLLELDNSEVNNLLENPQDLEDKVEEALAVLEAHEALHKDKRKILTSDDLDGLPPEDQKQVIGEKLYKAVLGRSRSQTVRENIGKIVGMLLEINNSELLNLLKEPKDLQIKVEEALAVLEAHKKKDSQVSKIYVCRSKRCAKRRKEKRQKLTSSSSSDSFYDAEGSIKDPELDEFFDLLKL